MKVAFIVSSIQGIYSPLATTPYEEKYLIVYNINVTSRFNETIEATSLNRKTVSDIVNMVLERGISAIALATLDEELIKMATSSGIGVYVASPGKRISDIIYALGG